MTGRKPKPTALKLLQGNPGNRPINKKEPKPKAQKPRAPTHLDDEAKKEWRRMSDKLFDLGLLTEIDKAALAAYCMAWSRWVQAELNIQKYGMVQLSPDKKWPVQSPYLPIANRAMEQMTKLLAEFGMTPSSRSRLQVDTGEKSDPFEEWASGRRSS